MHYPTPLSVAQFSLYRLCVLTNRKYVDGIAMNEAISFPSFGGARGGSRLFEGSCREISQSLIARYEAISTHFRHFEVLAEKSHFTTEAQRFFLLVVCPHQPKL